MNQGEPSTSHAPKRVGLPMSKTDWSEAVTLLRGRMTDGQGLVFLPKEGGKYAGSLLLMTDTHLVQRIGKSTAVAHDLNKLDVGPQLVANFESGTVKPGQLLRIRYGAEHEVAKGTLLSHNQQRADEMRKDLSEWALTHITNGRGREIFLKHLEAATQAVAGKPRSNPGRARVIAPQKTPSPSMER